MEEVRPDPDVLRKLATWQMPFGKYRGHLLVDLPCAYLEWFARQGFPPGQLGELLQSMHEIKLNGLASLLDPLRDRA